VVTLQIQTHLSRLGYQPGPLDGLLGSRTQTALSDAALADAALADALSELAEQVQSQRSDIPLLTVAQLAAFAPDGRPDWIGPMNAALVEAGITGERLPYFLAQLAHESGGLKHAREVGGESARYAPYFGRGPIQLTHEDNYRAAGAYLGLPLVEHPELVESPWIGWQCAAWYWLNTGLGRLCDARDFKGLTVAINGGTNGLADRERWLEKAERLFPRGGGPSRHRPP